MGELTYRPGYMQGIQLPSERQKGFFELVTVDDAARPLAETFERIKKAFEGALDRAHADANPPLLVVDDLSSLLWSGHGSRDVAAFFAGLRALVSRASVYLPFTTGAAAPDGTTWRLAR